MIELNIDRHGIFVVAWAQVSVMAVAHGVGFTKRSAERRLLKNLDKRYGKRDDW